MSLVESAAAALDGAFDRIPVMCVELMLSIDRLLKMLASNVGDASTPERRAALAHEIRNACMNVGFFYSEYIHQLFPNSSLYTCWQSLGTGYPRRLSTTWLQPWSLTFHFHLRPR